MSALADIARHLEDIERAPSKEAATLAKSLVLMKVANALGSDVQEVFTLLRPDPDKEQKLRGKPAVRPLNESLEHVVAGLAAKGIE